MKASNIKYIDKYIWEDTSRGCLGYKVFIHRHDLHVQERFETLEKAQVYRDECLKSLELRRIDKLKIDLDIKEYPYNLIKKLDFDPECYGTFEQRLQDLRDENFLNEREFYIVIEVFKNGLKLEQIGKLLGITRERVRQILEKTLRRIKYREKYFIYGEYANLEKIALKEYEEYKEKLLAKWTYESACEFLENYNQEQNNTLESKLYDSWEKYDFSVRTWNCLKRANIKTVGDIVELGTFGLLKLKNMGKKSVKEIMKHLNEDGIYFKEQILDYENEN